MPSKSCWGEAAIALAVAGVLSSPKFTLAQSSSRPNIIVILGDDLGYNEFGFQGSTTFKTPNLDALAASGTRFTNGYASCPLCTPTRAGLLTGRYQERFGVEYNANTADPSIGLPHDQSTLANALDSLGYSTGIVGKWHLGLTPDNLPTNRGFGSFYGYLPAAHDYFTDSSDNPVYRNTTPDPSWSQSGAYLPDVLSQEASSFIDLHHSDSNPFFLYLPYDTIHTPLEAKPSDLAMFPNLTGTTQVRAAMTYAMDRGVGQIMQTLQRDALASNTLIFFLSDNGGAADKFGADNTPLNGTKASMLEGGIRVPFVMAGPGVPSGMTYNQPISSLDIFPTVLSAAGSSSLPNNLDGVNLLPYINGQTPAATPHNELFWRLGAEAAVRNGDWKLATVNGAYKLFNLADDIGETTDLSAQNPAIVSRLKSDLTVWEAQLAKPLADPSTFLPIPQSANFTFVPPAVAGSAVAWNNTSTWRDRDAGGIVTTLNPVDSFANTSLTFPAAPWGYTAMNNMTRMDSLTFMANSLALGTDSAPSGAGTIFIRGNPVLLTPALNGAAPTIRLQGSSVSASSYAFAVNMDMQLLGDLQITGDGVSSYSLNGAISDYGSSPRAVIKTGSSSVGIYGSNSYSGGTTIAGGTVSILFPSSLGAGGSPVTLTTGGALRFDGSFAMAHPIQMTSPAGGVINTNGQSVTIAGAVNGTALTKTGGGTLALAAVPVHLDSLKLAAGTLVLPSAATSSLNSVPVIASSADLDLGAGPLIINYTGAAPLSAVRNLLINGRGAPGYGNATWNGSGGICSSMVRTGSGLSLALGYADNAALAAIDPHGSYTSFGGQTVSSNSILIRMTLAGDANLDGVVDGDDIAILGTHFNKPGSDQWFYGDFNYSGNCDSLDMTLLGTTFGKNMISLAPAQLSAQYGSAFASAFQAGMSSSAVPEPGMAGMIGAAAAIALITPRRRRRCAYRRDA